MEDNYQLYRNGKIPSHISRETLKLYLKDWNLDHLSDRAGLAAFVVKIEKQENCKYLIPEQKYYDES
jgi:hypothetical protein